MAIDLDIEKLVVDALHSLSTGDADAARALLEKAERVQPTDRDVLLLKATLLAAEDDLDAAIDMFDRALDLHPGDPLIASAKAALLLDVYDDVAAALPLLEDAADRLLVSGGLDKDLLHDVLVRLSETRLRAGDVEGAVAAAEEAHELDPGSADALVARGLALLELGEVADVKDLADAVIDAEPEHARAWSLRGAVYDLMADRPAADAAHRKAAALQPEVHPTPTTLGLTEFEAKVRAALTAPPEPYEDLVRTATITIDDVPPPGALRSRAPPRPHGSLVVVDVDEAADDDDAPGPATITFFRRAFEVAGVELDEVEEIAWAALSDDLDRLFTSDDDDDDELDDDDLDDER